jgi:uracil-DNA glycosylase
MELEKSWKEVIGKEVFLPYFQNLKSFIEEELKEGQVVYPHKERVFEAFTATPFDKVKVVIVGQDPYHGAGQAHGLSFSVPEDIKKIPPSLKNIFKELKADLQVPIAESGCLSRWAEQGVFLLNATLTVRAGEPKSHYGRGWETFTDSVIQALAEKEDPIVFLLWGRSAQDKGERVLAINQHHLVLKAAHPSPFSATKFLGCRHFSKANDFLIQSGKTPINW